MATSNYDTIIYLRQELADIIYQDGYSPDNLHHDTPHIYLDDLIGYKYFQ